jgi:hypothetical protein
LSVTSPQRRLSKLTGGYSMSRCSVLGASLIAVTLVGSVVVSAAEQKKVTHPRPAAAGQWRVIGQVTANFTADHDAIVVKGPNDDFHRIKIKVTDAPLHLKRLVVTYDNGEPERLDVRENIAKGGESRAIDLRGGRRSIRKIEFWYDTAGVLHGKADVTVFGQK